MDNRRVLTGHGHVKSRPDGVRARCGGPAICRVCQQEKAQLDLMVLGHATIDKYADLRAALGDGWVQSIHPDTVRDLLADHDRLRKAAKELADWVEYEVGASREESPGLAEIRAALAQEGGGHD